MMRMVDFQCVKCDRLFEAMVPRDRQVASHCGRPAKKVWLSAPGVHYRRRFSHALNRPVNSYREEERELAKKGEWIASAREANDAAQSDSFDEPVSVRREQKEKIRKKVERTAQKLVADGRISFRQ